MHRHGWLQLKASPLKHLGIHHRAEICEVKAEYTVDSVDEYRSYNVSVPQGSNLMEQRVYNERHWTSGYQRRKALLPSSPSHGIEGSHNRIQA